MENTNKNPNLIQVLDSLKYHCSDVKRESEAVKEISNAEDIMVRVDMVLDAYASNRLWKEVDAIRSELQSTRREHTEKLQKAIQECLVKLAIEL